VFCQHSAESAICCLGVRYVCSRSGFIVGLGGPSTIPWLTFLTPTQRRFCLTYLYVLRASTWGLCPSQPVSLLRHAPSFKLAQAIFEPKRFPYKYSNSLIPVILQIVSVSYFPFRVKVSAIEPNDVVKRRNG
jgi:hypothetical protein